MDYLDPHKNTVDLRPSKEVDRLYRIKRKLLERQRRKEESKLNTRRTIQTDWSDPAQVADLFADKYLDRRRRLLDRVCASRTCPSCGQVKLDSKQWILKEDLVICKACFQTKQPNKGFEVDLQEYMAPFVDILVNCEKFGMLLAKIGLSDVKVAEALGISRTQLARLYGDEGHDHYKMRIDTYAKLVALLKKLDCRIIEVEF